MFIIGISGAFIPYLFLVGVLVVFSIRISACTSEGTDEFDGLAPREISSDLCTSSPSSTTAFYFYENCLQEEPQTISGINKQSGLWEEMQVPFDFVDARRRLSGVSFLFSSVEMLCFSGLSPPDLTRLENYCL